jgi:transposase, IS30 family
MINRPKLAAFERDKIAYWRAIGLSMREIARRLGRSPSSISAEIRRNRPAGDVYHSIRAQQAAEIRKRQCHKKYLLATKRTLKAYVLEKLAAGWSPEQIAGRLKKEIREGSRPKQEYINPRIDLPIYV